MAGDPPYDHPEIDEFLARADEVLEECPTPKTSDPSTGTSSNTPSDRRGAKKPGSTKSKSHTGKAKGSPYELAPG